MRRLVIDPRVLVSAFISPRKSAPSIILEAVLDRRIAILACPALVTELTDVLSREKFAAYTTKEGAEDYIASISQHAEHHQDPPAGPQQTSDPDDDYLLALAHNHNADAIISGDKDLLDASTDQLPVLTPRQLADQLGLPAADGQEEDVASGEQTPPEQGETQTP